VKVHRRMEDLDATAASFDGLVASLASAGSAQSAALTEARGEVRVQREASATVLAELDAQAAALGVSAQRLARISELERIILSEKRKSRHEEAWFGGGAEDEPRQHFSQTRAPFNLAAQESNPNPNPNPKPNPDPCCPDPEPNPWMRARSRRVTAITRLLARRSWRADMWSQQANRELCQHQSTWWDQRLAEAGDHLAMLCSAVQTRQEMPSTTCYRFCRNLSKKA
jgi:hypothetical protein